MTAHQHRGFIKAFTKALSHTDPVHYLTAGNSALEMATGLLRSLVQGNGDLGGPGSDLGHLVANFCDRKSIEDPAHFMESCLELIGIENLVWFQETLTGTLIQSSQSDHKRHRTQKFQYRHSDQWKGSQPNLYSHEERVPQV